MGGRSWHRGSGEWDEWVDEEEDDDVWEFVSLVCIPPRRVMHSERM